MLRLAADRLLHTLSLQRLAFFLSGEDGRFYLQYVTSGPR